MKRNFNEILGSLRHEKGISQRTAAANLGISQALLSHYENGVREPGLNFLSNVCDYYGVSADYLLGLSTFRGKICFSEEQLDSLTPFINSAIALLASVISLDSTDDADNYFSLISAIYCRLSKLGRDKNDPGNRELIDSLIFLRQAQISAGGSKIDFKPPEELIKRTDDEISMLFNE